MKKIFFLAAVCVSIIASAQSNKEDVDLIQAAYGKEKKAIVAEFIQLEGAKKDAFWKLYDQYETERKTLGKKRIALLENYAANYGSMSDAAISKNIKETAALGLKTDQLISTYQQRIEKAAGAKAAAQFFQLEVYLLSAIRTSILENIPFIGELKHE